MKKMLCIILFLLAGCATQLPAQSVTIEKKGQRVVIKFPGKKIAESEYQEFEKRLSNYEFYELINPKDVTIRADLLENIKVQTAEVRNDGQELRLTLQNPNTFAFGTIYMLKIKNAKWDNNPVPVIRFELSEKAEVKVYNDPRNRLVVESNVEINDMAVKVEETTLKISPDDKNLVVEAKQVPITLEDEDPTLKVIKFGDELSEARNHYLQVKLLTDDGRMLTANPKISIAGLPKPNPKPDIDIFLASEFGGNLKPQFNLLGNFKRRIASSKNKVFYFEPTVTFDVGLGATKSKNAIILELPTVRYSFDLPTKPGCRIPIEPELKKPFAEVKESTNLKEGKKDTVPLPCYYEWKNRGLFSLYSIDFKAGPKFETDRRFSRANALGTVQFDFNFDRWQHSIANQISYLNEDLKGTQYKDYLNDVYVKRGFTLTPHIGFEFGRKLTGEVIENKAKTVRFVIPQNPIFRSYAGIVAVFEWNYGFLPVKLTISEDLFYLAYRETVGNIVNNNLDLRQVRGFHPYGKMAWDIAFDPAKRYNFTIIYENGRAAPNFEYLNSVKAGFRVVY